MSKTFYDISLKTIKEAKKAHQDRIEIEKECRESIRLLEMHQNQFNEMFERYFHGTIKFFNESFDELERALYAGDADLAIGANSLIHRHEDWLDRSDLAREEKKAVCAELQKSIDENLEALKKS
ncbi:hypothetical protein E5L04_03730 [Helicobacter pylori]|nr:hypothetical protein [Helicobacter pylori]WRC87809.1 hypothetical protein E5L04_03730 [Helicobacter pylori]